MDAVILPDGEQFKTVDVLSAIWDKALELRLDRKSMFVALGGGVIGDMTGFAAASYQRGISFLQVCYHSPPRIHVAVLRITRAFNTQKMKVLE